MSHVLLLNPTPAGNSLRYLPYALLYLKSALEANSHTTTIIDFQLERRAFADLKDALAKAPEYLGISLFCGPGVALACRAAALCRKISPGTKIIWGGVLPSVVPELVLRDAFADF